MSPDRKITIDGKLIEEYYWNRKMLCYIDHHLSDKTYDENVKILLTPNKEEM